MVEYLEYINEHFSSIISAFASIASAIFAFTIWKETKKYREITNELKSLNEKIVTQSYPKLDIQTPNEIEDSGQSSGIVKFFIPIWLINLSSMPTTILYLYIKDLTNKALIIYNDLNRQSALRMPLKEPLNLASFSSEVKYIYQTCNVNNESKLLPTVDFEIGYKGIDGELKTQKLKYQVEKIQINKHRLIKVQNGSLV